MVIQLMIETTRVSESPEEKIREQEWQGVKHKLQRAVLLPWEPKPVRRGSYFYLFPIHHKEWSV